MRLSRLAMAHGGVFGTTWHTSVARTLSPPDTYSLRRRVQRFWASVMVPGIGHWGRSVATCGWRARLARKRSKTALCREHRRFPAG